MKNNLTRALITMLVLCCILACPVLTVNADAKSRSIISGQAPGSEVRYVNPDTKYKVMLRDDLSLLTVKQQDKLADEMIKLTDYGDVLYWTADSITQDDVDKKTKDCLGDGSEYHAICLICYSKKDNILWAGGEDTSEEDSGDDGVNFADITADYINKSGWFNGVRDSFNLMYDYLSGKMDEDGQFEPKVISDEEMLRYTNPETNYRVLIIDELDLLTAEEEGKLLEEMIPITQYGNVAFWTNAIYSDNTLDQARLKRLELFDYDSGTVCMINMANRRIEIQSYGTLYRYLTDSVARSITDNAAPHLTEKKYYDGAALVYRQEYDILEGHDIPEPMKMAGYITFAVILGLTITLSIAFSAKLNPLRAAVNDKGNIKGKGTWNRKGARTKIRSYTHSSSSSGCGGGGCCGGGCGGGGCGGGGGSSF